MAHRRYNVKDIRFRGKRKDNGEYVQGYYIEDYGLERGPQIIPFYYHLEYGRAECYYVEPGTVQQYMGEDEDGNEVWE